MYRLNEEQTAIVESARGIADDVIAPKAAEADSESRFPHEAVGALGKSGLLGLTVPNAFGGMGQGVRVAAAVLDTIARRDASAGMIYLMHMCGIACYSAAPQMGESYLREAAAGRH